MAVVVTAASGYDLGYVWKNQGERGEPEHPAGGYYISAAQAGEPPGRWWGPGARALGFADGQVVDRGPYERVYRQIDPRTGQRLGRARGSYVPFADHLARLRAAEPHATAERLLELEREAAQATRQAPAYTDMTVSFSKSISVFHASIRENERRARLAGHRAEAARWAEARQRLCEVLHAANRAGLEYAQKHAGFTRTGYHGTRVQGGEPGRFEEAGLVVTSWLQGTSRDGDPQDHVHNQIARMVQTGSDGRWRALDTVSLRGILGAVQAVVAAHVECGLAREFGVAWVPRADGAGNEIAGITQQQMDAYSTRTVSITGRLPAAVASWTARHGRAPNRRELLHIRQEVTMATRNGKDPGVIDWDAVAARWDAKLGGQLASIAPRVSGLTARAPGAAHETGATADAQPRAAPGAHARAQASAPAAARTRAAPVPREELTRAAQRALAAVQAAHSTWTRSDLIKHLGLALPAQTRNMAPDDAVALLDDLADLALSGQAEPVVRLEAPQWPPLPAALIRGLDGRSVYTRPGTTRYATGVQLSLEEQLLADAQRAGAPRLEPGRAAALLGADAADLDAALAQGPRTDSARPADRHLRLDQAAALYYALTGDRTAVVLTGPAGSGKTRVLAEAARAWTQAGRGEVIGIATAQAARNVLAAAGVTVADNSAEFLGHLPGRRGARGIRPLRPGTLVVIDEASMMSLPDLADILAHAARCGAKVIVAGDQEQLAAVESGGGMSLLASRIGYVQLAEAVRFREQWERDASLRLRAGDASALDEYHQHGRLRGAPPEQALDDAVGRYVAHHLAGRDVLLMIRDNERRRELSRRIREDLIHLGVVDGTGPAVTLADGARASAGDLILCRRNDRRLEAGEPGRTLANGDTLRVEKVLPDGRITVRRALDCDQATGYRRWTAAAFTYDGCATADLAYAVTGHAAEGRTVAAGIALVTGTEDRQWLYVALTRGFASNTAIAFTEPARPADPQAGTRPAPELERHARIQAERAALSAPPAPPGSSTQPDPREPVAVIADALDRDGSEASALHTWDRALADADHLAVLHAVWQDQTIRLQTSRYKAAVAAALPAGYPPGTLDTPTATWLWRTLRAAETAGLDPDEVARQAVQSRPLTGARDIPAVVDFRLRQITGPLVPLPPRPWSEQVPCTADPELREFLTRLAEAMDARKDRIGEQLADFPEQWTLRSLGPVPGDPLDRLGWQRRAADVGAYRELYGWDHPSEPIGPEPAGDSPDKRAVWHVAFAAIRPAVGPDVRALPDGELLSLRARYQAETAWAPRHTGRELACIRSSAGDAALAAIRHRAEEQIARHGGQHQIAARHGALARSFTAMEQFYHQQEAELDQTMAVRRQWEQATEQNRRLAVAADAELRRRHPGQRIEPLRSAEPALTDAERAQLDLAPGGEAYQTPDWIKTLAAERRAVRERLAERDHADVPDRHADSPRDVLTWPATPGWNHGAILQPPRPQIRPAPGVAQRAAQTHAEAQ